MLRFIPLKSFEKLLVNFGFSKFQISFWIRLGFLYYIKAQEKKTNSLFLFDGELIFRSGCFSRSLLLYMKKAHCPELGKTVYKTIHTETATLRDSNILSSTSNLISFLSRPISTYSANLSFKSSGRFVELLHPNISLAALGSA